MALSVVMPALEMAQETGKVVAWKKQEGELVKKGELTKKFVLKGVLATAGAKAAVESAGGSLE